MKVLVVEDDPITRNVLSQMLKKRGHEVVSVESAESALPLVLEQAFPMAFLDLSLPGMDGLELSRHFRKLPNGDQTYIIVGTALMLEEGATYTLSDILELADDYIPKPYSPDRLNVRMAIAEKRVAQALSSQQKEMTLKQERDFLTSVVDSASALIMVVDIDHEVVTMNRWCSQMFETRLYPPIKFPQGLIVGDYCGAVEAALKQLRETREPVTFDTLIRNSKGAEYFISWTASLASLEDADSHIICSGLDTTEHYLDRMRLTSLANRDPLTDLFNRNYLPDALEEMKRKSNSGILCFLLEVDLDGFKSVNDTFGHATGDRLLVAVAGIMLEGTRPNDIVVRTGGDEFLIFLFHLSLEGALAISEKIRSLISEFSFAGREEISISSSIGLVQVNADVDGDTAVARADEACYRAKSLGKNRVEVYSEQVAFLSKSGALVKNKR